MNLRSAEVLRAFINQKGFSRAQLAYLAGCSKSFIGFLATGDKTSCSPDLAARIAEALAVPVDVLFDHRPSTAGRQNEGRAA